MFKFYASIATAFALVVIATPADAAGYRNASYFDAQLKITQRLNAGTLVKDVERVHTVTVNGKTFVVEKNVNANMSHLRRLSDCSTRPGECKKNTAWEL
jgi:hypothetical protein